MPKGYKNDGTFSGIVFKKGMKHSKEFKRKLSSSHCWKSSWNKGKKWSDEQRKKFSLSHKRGENHWNWKGGITCINEGVRKSIELRLWRESVFARDNWTCQNCGKRSEKNKKVYLHAHHIVSFAKFPELRTSIENGITLCKKCHYKNHKK